MEATMTKAPSARETLARDFAIWVSDAKYADTGNRVFTAPYGVLEGLEKGNKARGVTFGKARISDIHLSIYSPRYMILRDSRYGGGKFTSIDEVKAFLRENYRFEG